MLLWCLCGTFTMRMMIKLHEYSTVQSASHFFCYFLFFSSLLALPPLVLLSFISLHLIAFLLSLFFPYQFILLPFLLNPTVFLPFLFLFYFLFIINLFRLFIFFSISSSVSVPLLLPLLPIILIPPLLFHSLSIIYWLTTQLLPLSLLIVLFLSVLFFSSISSTPPHILLFIPRFSYFKTTTPSTHPFTQSTCQYGINQ